MEGRYENPLDIFFAFRALRKALSGMYEVDPESLTGSKVRIPLLN